jgi:DNA modification methylase
MPTDLNRIIHADITKEIPLPDKSVNCILTSPPYWGLRDYGVEGQLGLEKTPEEYVSEMVKVFRECWRVLKDDGTVWLNLGDSYASSGKNRTEKQATAKSTLNGSTRSQMSILKQQSKITDGLKPKDLVGIPWMVAFALRTDGWYLRQDIIWHKPNPMPESVTDRCTKAHEYIFLLSKSQKYYFDNEAIKEPLADSSISRLNQDIENQHGSDRIPGKINGNMKAVFSRRNDRSGESNFTRRKHQDSNIGGGGSGFKGHSGNCDLDGNLIGGGMRNKRSVWTVTTQPYKEAHFATFPEKLIEPCILAGSPKGGIVLDPFMGAGTTALVALKYDRNFIGFELNPEYIKIAKKRIDYQLNQGRLF